MHHGITENIWERTENELLGNPLHTDIPTIRTISPGAVHIDFNPLYTLVQRMGRYTAD